MAESVTVPRRSTQKSCDSNVHDGTPPDRHISLPLTPPASDEQRQPSAGFSVESTLRVFKNLQDHHLEEFDNRYKTIHLQPDQYLQLLRALECDQSLQGYVSDKVRWDYDPKTALLDFRMPTPVHDFFATSVAREICKQIEHIASGEGAASEFASHITNGGSSRIFLKEGAFKEEPAGTKIFPQRQPDAQFQHSAAAYPAVVLEVSYSQNGKNLWKLARDYILSSNGDIKVVIGLNIDYGGTKESTLSLWRPSYIQEEGEELDLLDVQQVIHSQPFQAQDGSAMNRTQHIYFDLSDFAPDTLSANFRGIQLEISYEKLAYLLTLAEEMHQTRESTPGIKTERKTRKRKLSSSPAEEIRSDDETKHRLWEEKDAEHSAGHDSDFLPPSRRRKR